MKNTFSCPFFIIIAWMIFTSCGNDEKILVKEAGDHFFSAIVSEDLATAKRYVTQSTSEKWEDASDIFENSLDSKTKDALQSTASPIDKIEVDGKNATITITVPLPSTTGKISRLHFSKENGKWLINEPGLFLKEAIEQKPAPVVGDTTEIIEELIE